MANWTLLSAALAPLLLIAGWTLAAARQAHFDAYTETISALAALAARDRWIMTCALIGLGLCHVATALGLRAARWPGRVTLALGGVCTLLVAAFPLDAESEGRAHALAASAAFLCLAVWPLFAMSQKRDTPSALRPICAVSSALFLSSLVAWLSWALQRASHVGLAERVAAAAQALWPLCVAMNVRRRDTTHNNSLQSRPKVVV